MCPWKDLHTNAHSGVIYGSLKVDTTTRMVNNKGMAKQLWYIHTTECYSARKRSELHVTIWKDLKITGLHKKRQPKKRIYYRFLLYKILENAN